MSHAVRCSSCRRTIGLAEYEKTMRSAVYCSEWCMEQPPVTEQEVRNDLWKALYYQNVPPYRIGQTWGVAHSLVYRTLERG